MLCYLVCRKLGIGPAIVFDASWDLAGALRIMYGDDTIRADVVTPTLRVEETGLKVSTYGVMTEYPYRRLLVYHAGLRRHFAFDDAAAARRYFQTHNPTHDSHCPPGREGHGVRIFGRSLVSRLQPGGRGTASTRLDWRLRDAPQDAFRFTREDASQLAVARHMRGRRRTSRTGR